MKDVPLNKTRNTSDKQNETPMKQLPFCLLFLALTASRSAQNVVATDTSNHEMQSVPHATSGTFVVGDRSPLQDAAVATAQLRRVEGV